MQIDTKLLVPMTEANQNFSKVARLVDENGTAVIMKNNKPRYVLVGFDEYDVIKSAREKQFSNLVSTFIEENKEALQVLATC
jgi:antitoxin Phd